MQTSSKPRHRWTLTRNHLAGTSLQLTGAPRLVAVYEGDRQLEHGQDYIREGMNLIIFTENPDLISVKELAWHPKTALRSDLTGEVWSALHPKDRKRYLDGEI